MLAGWLPNHLVSQSKPSNLFLENSTLTKMIWQSTPTFKEMVAVKESLARPRWHWSRERLQTIQARVFTLRETTVASLTASRSD